MSIPASSATNKIGLFVNLSETITSEIVSLSSLLSILIKSLILLSIFLSSFLVFSPTLETSTFPLVIDLKS